MPVNNIERLPESMRSSYSTGGILKNVVRRGRNTLADQRVYDQLIQLGHNNESSAVVDLARALNMVRVNKAGEIKWTENATADQFDALAGMAIGKLIQLRRGSPLYPRDPDVNG